MLLKSRDITRTEISSQQDWDVLASRMEQEVNFTFFESDQIFKLAGIAMGFTLVFGYAINHYEGFPMRFESIQEIRT